DRAKLIKQISKLRDALYNERFEGGIRGEKDTVCSVNRLKMEYENKIRKLEIERDGAVAELDRLKSIVRILHEKKIHSGVDGQYLHMYSPNLSEPCPVSKHMFPCPSGLLHNRRSSSLASTPEHNGSSFTQKLGASKLRSRSASTDSSSYLGGISKKSQRAVSPSRSRNRYSRDSVRSLPVSGPRSHKDSNKFVTPPSPKRRSRARSANSVGSKNRFDPTAFVQKQRQKRQEAKQK
uniref:Cwf21 domain-containing protein n=2 Tax=Mesocestoides corti TaxID=53468 RepID=A0A5K3F5I1_MESCO